MNSAPIPAVINIDATKTPIEPKTVCLRCDNAQSSDRSYRARIHSKARLRFSFTPPRSTHPASTGITVSVMRSAPISAKIVVSAIGRNNRPDGPDST